MEQLQNYKVDLNGIAGDTVSYQWHVEDDFFSVVQGPEIQRGRLYVALRVKRTSGAYELVFDISGEVEVQCDRCLEPMEQPIHATHTLRARLGEEYDDDGDIITVPVEEGLLDVAWYIYEIAALEIPIRHVHPDGQCKGETAEALNQCNADEEEAHEEKEVDPRWSALKDLLKNK